jgi:hypothetical protein
VPPTRTTFLGRPKTVKTIEDLQVAGQRVFVRADLNVPLSGGTITDDGRIRAVAPTIAKLVQAGAKVVVETSLDNGSAASIEKLFTSAGGKAIDYDRQVTGGTASVYVTFDGNAVGRAQANGIIAAMKKNGSYGKMNQTMQAYVPRKGFVGSDYVEYVISYELYGKRASTTIQNQITVQEGQPF